MADSIVHPSDKELMVQGWSAPTLVIDNKKMEKGDKQDKLTFWMN